MAKLMITSDIKFWPIRWFCWVDVRI